MTHRVYTFLVVVACAAGAVPIALLSTMSYLAALLTLLGVAIAIVAIGVLRDAPSSPRLHSRSAAQRPPRRLGDDDDGRA